MRTFGNIVLGAVAGMAEFIDPDELIVQYCFRDQAVLDRALLYIGSLSPDAC